jgi:hypothetical protein
MLQGRLSAVRLITVRGVLTAQRGALIFVLLGALAFTLTLYLLAPGYMCTDSGVQLEQARAQAYGDWHPVLMSVLWHYTDKVLPGPIGMLLLHAALHWFGLGLFFWALPGPLLARAAGFLALGVFPPVFSSLPMILKDMLMQGSLVAGLALAARPRASWLRWLLVLVLFVIGLGARHNAVAAVWPLLALLFWHTPALFRQPARWRNLSLACGGGVVLALALKVGLAKVLDPISQKEEIWQTVAMFDLAGISLETGEVLIEPGAGFFTEGMTLEELESRFNPEYSIKLIDCLPFRDQGCAPAFRLSTDADALGLLRDNWRRVVLAHPGAYLAYRAKVALPLLGLSGGPEGLFYPNGAPYHPIAADYPIHKRTLRILRWFDAHLSSPWFWPWLYVALAMILFPFAFRAFSRDNQPLPLLLLCSGLCYLATILVAAPTSEFRYSVWTILCTLLAVASLTYPRLDRSNRLAPDAR